MNTKPQAVTELLFLRLSPNTFLLTFASLLADISTQMQYPVLPTFLTQTLRLMWVNGYGEQGALIEVGAWRVDGDRKCNRCGEYVPV